MDFRCLTSHSLVRVPRLFPMRFLNSECIAEIAAKNQFEHPRRLCRQLFSLNRQMRVYDENGDYNDQLQMLHQIMVGRITEAACILIAYQPTE